MIETAKLRWVAQHLGDANAPLSRGDAVALAEALSGRRVSAGTVVFHRDEHPGEVFIVESGQVALLRPRANQSSYLQRLGPGDVFGDVGLLLGHNAPVDALAIEDTTLLTVPESELMKLLSTRPTIAMRWMISMAKRLETLQDRLEELLAGPLDTQLATLLMRLADSEGVVAASQQTLAHLLGARRPSVARSLGQLEERGYICKQYREIRVLDNAGLGSFASS